jgi:hypothetical protein
MISEELEFSISQYVDGTLPPAERESLEHILTENVEAKSLLDEYLRLNIVLRRSPLPAMNFDALAMSISSAVDDAEEERIAGRYRMPSWVRAAALPLSLAASILIVAGVGIQAYLAHHSIIPSPSFNHPTASNEQMAIEIGPTAPASSGPSQEDVSIGPGAAMNDQPLIVQYSSDVISHQSHVTIASGGPPMQDIEASPSFDIE